LCSKRGGFTLPVKGGGSSAQKTLNANGGGITNNFLEIDRPDAVRI
jgi:hypothetical protein